MKHILLSPWLGPMLMLIGGAMIVAALLTHPADGRRSTDGPDGWVLTASTACTQSSRADGADWYAAQEGPDTTNE